MSYKGAIIAQSILKEGFLGVAAVHMLQFSGDHVTLFMHHIRCLLTPDVSLDSLDCFSVGRSASIDVNSGVQRDLTAIFYWLGTPSSH